MEKFDKALKQLAKPPNDITLGRANFAEFLVSSTRHIADSWKEVKSQGRSEEEHRREIADRVQQLKDRIQKMKRLGDPAADNFSRTLSGVGDAAVQEIFMEHKFFIDPGLWDPMLDMEQKRILLGYNPQLSDPGYAYGPLVREYSFAGRTYHLGAMMMSNKRSNWSYDGSQSVIDIARAVQEAYEILTTNRFSHFTFEVAIGDEQNRRASRKFKRPLNEEEIRGSLLSEALTAKKVEKLIGKAKSQAQRLERALDALYRRFNHLIMKHNHREDEIDHFLAISNAIIKDEMVRAYARSHGWNRIFEDLVTCAYGNPFRTLAQAGLFGLSGLKAHLKTDSATQYLILVGGSILRREFPEPAGYVPHLLVTGADEMSDRAKELIQNMTISGEVITKMDCRELARIEDREFIGKSELSAVLGVTDYLDEKFRDTDN